MKTITIIITAVLALSINILFASTPSATHPVSNKTVLSILAPIIPMEASFDDADMIPDYSSLIPSTPAEATFEEASPNFDYSNLVPAFPATADFE